MTASSLPGDTLVSFWFIFDQSPIIHADRVKTDAGTTSLDSFVQGGHHLLDYKCLPHAIVIA